MALKYSTFLKLEGDVDEASGLASLAAPQIAGRDPAGYAWRFQCTSLAGGTVDVQVLGPAGAWITQASGIAEGDVAEVTSGWGEFQFVFNGTGGAGKVTYLADRQFNTVGG